MLVANGSPWRSFLFVGASFNDPTACAAARLLPRRALLLTRLSFASFGSEKYYKHGILIYALCLIYTIFR